ncbi:MAG: protein kinase [Deltaproteobacteria bacterium]|nr:protein kinase [Myxococcales bacterium]MDP3217224.1 protein kinase [Deltaproteobacteria bacterium]
MDTLTLEPGQIVDREYKVERLLSQGGMGAVYVVEHVTTGKRRALKVMLSHLVRDQASRDRFEREARIGARIESDNVVEVVDAGVDEATGLPFLVMELLDGVDLDHVIETQKIIPPKGVADIVDQLCDALGRGHAIGVVHSDLKPENVFLEKPRRRGVAFTVKVMDFGIAKLISDEVREARVTTPMGSPLWMAPEQTQRGAAITPATDVWALGLLVYRMLTGVSYWRGANAPEGKVSVGTMVLEVVVRPLDPASLRAQEMGVAALLPAGFDGWFARCVVREQDQRFANASLAWDALEPVLAGASRASTVPQVPTYVAPVAQVATQAAPPQHMPTQVAPMPGSWGGPAAPTGPQSWSQPIAPQEVRWPMVQQRVYAPAQGGQYQMATVLEVNKQSSMIRVRLDTGAEGWLPASQLRSTF